MDELDKKIEEKASNIVPKPVETQENLEPKEETADVVEEKKETEQQPIVVQEKKSLSEVNINDVQFTLNKEKSFEEQAEDVVNAMAIAKAVNDEETAKDLSEKKAEELKSKASGKLKEAQAREKNAESDLQEAQRKKNEAVLSTFGVLKHLPDWLLKIMVFIFSPVYVVLTVIIGVPCGVVKVLIDNIDNILVRYESAEETNKPKIKVTVWIVLVGLILGITALVLLKCFDKI
jgi:uncharacterized membrane protein